MSVIKVDYGEVGGGGQILTGDQTDTSLPWLPDELTIYAPSTSAQGRFCIDKYNGAWSTSQYYEQLGESGYTLSLPTNNVYGLNTLTSSGFTVGSSMGNFTWTAIKY